MGKEEPAKGDKGNLSDRPDMRGMADDEMEIDLIELLGVYLENILIILIALVIGAVSMYGYTYFTKAPYYTASAKLYMLSSAGSSVVDVSSLTVGSSLATDYEELIRIREIGETVIEKLELPYTYEGLESMISISNTTNTRVLVVSVTSNDSTEAMEIANMTVDAVQKILPERTDTLKPKIIEYAVIPDARSGPNYKKSIFMGGALGALLVMGVLTILFIMDNSLHNGDDLEKEFGMLPLAVIPEGNLTEISDKKEKEIAREKKKARYIRKAKELWNRVNFMNNGRQ